MTSSPLKDCLSFVDYFARRGFYRHLQRSCADYQNKYGRNDKVTFWKAFALAMEGNLSDSIRELEPLQGRHEVSLAVTAALITTHNMMQHKDRETVSALKQRLKEESGTNDEVTLTFAGQYFLHAQKLKQSRKCIDKVLSISRKNPTALCVYGWLNLDSGVEKYEKKSASFFEAALNLDQSSQKDISAMLGRVTYNERHDEYGLVLEDLNLLIVTYPQFIPALAEKARVLIVMGNWEEAIETANRVLRQDMYNVDALRIIVLFLLAKESKADVVSKRIQELHKAIETMEPRSAQLCYDTSRLVARLAGRGSPLLKLSVQLIEKACKLAPLNSDLMTEHANQLAMIGDYKGAIDVYSEAGQLDESNILALVGRIKCNLALGNVSQASQEFEFVKEVTETEADIDGSQGKIPEMIHLEALFLSKLKKESSQCAQFLLTCMQVHMTNAVQASPGFPRYIALNPDFVLEVVEDLIQYVGTEPMSKGDMPSPILDNVCAILSKLAHYVPGVLNVQLFLARGKFIAGDFEAAEKALFRVFQLDNQFAAAYMLQAQISLAKGSFKQTAHSLEQALSLDFEVRNTPMFHYIKSILLDKSGKTADALDLIKSAMNLPGVRRESSSAAVPTQERVTLFLELVRLHAKLKHIPEATKTLQDARLEFEKTPEFSRVMMVEADVAISQRNIERGIRVLRTVPADSVYYTRARMKMADIYLTHKRNRKMYASCYQELAYEGNTAHHFVLLGEAYIRIQEPSNAIKAYEEALKLEPDNAMLANKIGRAFISTHDYRRAIKYYETAVAKDGNKHIDLVHELADLYFELQQYDEAIRVLEAALNGFSPGVDSTGIETAELIGHIRTMMALNRVYEALDRIEDAHEYMNFAHSIQVTVLDRVRTRDADEARKQKVSAAELCYKIAMFHKKHPRVKEDYKAFEFLNEALKYNDKHQPSLLALAKMHLATNELNSCQEQCNTLKRLDPENLEVSMMLADIMFRKEEHDQASVHFQRLLADNPNHYDALRKLLWLLRRSGHLSEAPRFLAEAEAANPRAQFDAGFHFCKGLYHWFTNEPREALKQLNLARKDGTYGKEAIERMIDIYLNPDNASLFQESTEAKAENAEHLLAAENLIKELFVLQEGGTPSKEYRVLEAYALMANRQKALIEDSVKKLTALLQNDRDYIPALLGVANAFMLLKQTPKARNQLKRITKMPYNSTYGLEFERAWLMLADIYIKSGKFDLATDLCKKALSNNKSSAKALEQLGVIMEKEESYQDAAEHYEKAWSFLNESSAPIGFKLAFNYLKAKRYLDAIDVCHKVLRMFPKYPKIHKEILQKARLAIRP